MSSDTSTSSHPPHRASDDLTTLQSLLRLYPWMKPAIGRVITGMVAALGAAIVALIIPNVLEYLVNGSLSKGVTTKVLPSALIILVLGIAEAALISARRWLVLTPGTKVEADLRKSIYAKLQELPVSFHDRWPSGQLLSRMMSDLNLIRRWLAFGIVLLVVNSVTIVVGFLILFSKSWLLALVMVAASIPLWIAGFRFESAYRQVARRSQDQAGDLATAVEESVHGIRVLKAFGRGPHALGRFVRQAEELRGTELGKARLEASLWLWLLMVPDVAFAVCVVLGVWLTSQGQISVGGLLAFFAIATVLREPIESIGFLLSMTYDTRTATDRFFEVIDTPDSLVDPEHPETIEHVRGELAFHDVHFHYEDSPAEYRDLIDGIDLVVEPGETMALVGLTGSGKSTLTSLTTRLYDVTGGSITLDGVDVRALGREELRTHIAMAFEDATLFSASVRDNVLLGRGDLAGSDEVTRRAADAQVAEALEVAQAQFAYDLPEGIETKVGEEGLSLSGGQRQRLALARAVAAKPAVLVLDDPLSALDVDTEALVTEALRSVLGTTTALIVAHRPSTVMLADRVAVLRDGRIDAVGTHSELLASSEHYRFVISSLEDEEEGRLPVDDASDTEEVSA